jgi:hypothetical protein
MPARILFAAGCILVALSAATPPADAARAGSSVNPQHAGLQVALRSWGEYHGAIDGIAGPMTAAAVRHFQHRKGLTVDGIPGPRTRHALGRLGRPLYGKRLLRIGMVGWDVAVLQFMLTRRGAPTGIIDGYFGRETSLALRRFQRRAGLAADAVAGPVTRRALGGGRPVRPASTSSSGRATIRGKLNYWAGRYGMSARLVRALAWIESGWQPDVVSRAGAFGVMQVTPATWDYVEEVLVGEQIQRTTDGNIRVGVLFLRQMYREFDGRIRLALAAYNQGPTSVRRNGASREARRFAADVLAMMGRV